MTTTDPAVISWDIAERDMGDGSRVFDVVGTSDECRVTFNCADEHMAEELVAMLNSTGVVGATAEAAR